jgi:heme oxygenase
MINNRLAALDMLAEWYERELDKAMMKDYLSQTSFVPHNINRIYRNQRWAQRIHILKAKQKDNK